MDVTITTRHCTVPDSVRAQTLRRAGRLGRFHPRAKTATVNFDAESGRKRCEARLVVDGGPPLFASHDDMNFRTALNGALERLERQLKRQRQRRIRRRTGHAS